MTKTEINHGKNSGKSFWAFCLVCTGDILSNELILWLTILLTIVNKAKGQFT